MRKWGMLVVTLLAGYSVACSQSDQDRARDQAQHAREQANKDLHRAAHDARQGFDKADRAVTRALDEAREKTKDAVHEVNQNPHDKSTDRDHRDSGASSQH